MQITNIQLQLPLPTISRYRFTPTHNNSLEWSWTLAS